MFKKYLQPGLPRFNGSFRRSCSEASELRMGFTLTEIMVAVVIFALIVVVISSVHLLSQQAYQGSENRAELVQNGRVILEKMSREIRQARKIVTDLPEEEIEPCSEIEFQDGHINSVYETSTPQAIGTTTITLSSDSTTTDFYKDCFIEIISGQGEGEIRKIIEYNGGTKIATLEKAWDVKPNTSSVYKIDSSYYYIRYFATSTSIAREVLAYCLSDDGSTCAGPYYVPYNTTSTTQTLITKKLETSRIIGEYIANLSLWGARLINIDLSLKKGSEEIEMKTKIYGRNL